MNNKLIWLGIVTVLLVLGFVLAGRFLGIATTPKSQTKKLQITASFYPLYFFASQIGNDLVQVQNITPAGAEPHDYEPTTQDIARIENSDLLILNGAVESWGDKIKDNLKGKKTKVAVAGEGLLTQQLTENGQTTLDPHIWLSPPLAKKETEKISAGIISVDPQHSQVYQDNEKKLATKLDQLDAEYKTGLANCKQKDIITSHAAFGYLASTYGLNQVPIAGLSPDQEPSAKQLAEVANFAKQHNVKYIFFEKLVSPKLSETIASEIGAKTLVLDPLEGLTEDDIKSGKDYFSVMQDNLKNLQLALQCTS